MIGRLLLLCSALLLLAGCDTPPPTPVAAQGHCVDCHQVELDPHHQLACTSCHRGTEPAKDQESAHRDLLARPAHPDHLQEICGPCHQETAEQIGSSSHFTLPRTTNLFRTAFGAEERLANFLDTPASLEPENILELADDLLRRRCFRCHLYHEGDGYSAVQRGTGCAACHLPYFEGRLVSHRFRPPQDEQCLSCHYGNYVGFDYYGRFEHDLTYEYRTPFPSEGAASRPYGVEYHQLRPDIHQLSGMRCIDCHSGGELMHNSGEKPACRGCHFPDQLAKTVPPRVELKESQAVLLGSDGQRRPIPMASNPAHFTQSEEITCQACHAQWSFNDIGKHYLRSDSFFVDDWWFLAVQGSDEVERVITINSDFDLAEELPVAMTDKLSGADRPGIWLKALTMRRWEEVILGRDQQGRISPMRPVEDWYLSWVDEEETVRYDSHPSATATHGGLRPYVPHTTGPAGLFASERIARFLREEAAAQAVPAPINQVDSSLQVR